MKMYTGAESSKETQHISPHIAAHKSSLAPTSTVSTLSSVGLAVSGATHDLAHSHLDNKSAINSHIPTYKVGMHPPHHSVVKHLEHDSPMYLAPRHGHSVHTSHSLAHSRSTPQDLSAHASANNEKAVPLELTPHSSVHHKPLPHIHTVVSPSAGGNQLGTLIPAHQTDRSSYFRMPDSVISVQGPSAVLVSGVGEGGISSSPHGSHNTTMVHGHSTLPSHSSANLTTMPAATTMQGSIIPVSAVSMTHNHVMASECVGAPHIASGCAMPQLDLRGVKKEKGDHVEGLGHASGSQQGPQRDLVRQALQAVVTNPQHKTGNDQEVIEYNYTAGDIAELLMMNIQVNASLQTVNKGPGNPPAEPSGGGEVVVLQPAVVDENTSLIQQPLTPKRRNRPRVSEEAQMDRRIRIAMRMREKRATESDEQKKLRRMREAERMRRKRSMEDDDSKLRRREEAAGRARNRRATMSVEERIMDRQRAADRMRLRRATESDDAKVARRLKAAERMRKRRASETPDQRNKRRQIIAMRMKFRRKSKVEDDLDLNGDDEPEIITRSITTRYGRANSVPHSESSEVGNVNPEHSTSNASQLVSNSSHIFVPSSIGVGGGITLLQVDPSLSEMSVGHTPGISTVDMTQLSQPLSLQKSSATNREQDVEVHKHEVPSQQSSPAATPTSESSITPSSHHASLEPLSLHKTSTYHHHLPHLLHYHHQPPTTTSSQQPTHQQPSHHHHPHHHHHSHHRYHHQ